MVGLLARGMVVAMSLTTASVCSTTPTESQDQGRVPLRITRRLYVSHFLSTWNSRVFEFGAVLYLATIFPGSLLPMSVYALMRGLSAIVFAPTVGQYVDTSNRLQVVRVSIIFQRLVVSASRIIFYVLAARLPLGRGGELGMLALLSFLACIETLCSIMNLVSVEKDWASRRYKHTRIQADCRMRPIVVVADKNHAALMIINAQMRRIDLLCELLGPLFIALVAGFSTEVAIIVNLVMNVASIALEYFAIARVYYEVAGLQEPKQGPHRAQPAEAEPAQNHASRLARGWIRTCGVFRESTRDFRFYFHHGAFLPSIAGALLYLTVLCFAGQMVTYLLSAGYTTTQVGITRTLRVVFEVLATWVAPWLMGRIGPARAGLWMSSWQVATLAAGTALFWIFDDAPLVSASGLVGGTILSRLGLRGFELCVEIIFSRPEQFKWPSLISVWAVALAWTA